MGLITGDTEKPPATGKGLVGRLTAVTSVFSRKKAPETPSPPSTTPPHPAPVADTTKPEAPPPPTQPDRPPQEPAPVAPPVAPPSAAGEQGEQPDEHAANSTKKDVDVQPNAADPVDPDMKVVPFDVREPSLGAAVTGHVVILEGSCYVWAGTEGSAAQGSFAAAVGTRFDGGMPTATPLLAGEGAASGLSVSMAQRLCKRTGRVVFVSCDLSEDSQILVAAVEAKVVALLKAEG